MSTAFPPEWRLGGVNLWPLTAVVILTTTPVDTAALLISFNKLIFILSVDGLAPFIIPSLKFTLGYWALVFFKVVVLFVCDNGFCPWGLISLAVISLKFPLDIQYDSKVVNHLLFSIVCSSFLIKNSTVLG